MVQYNTQGPYPFVEERARPLLEELRASDSNLHPDAYESASTQDDLHRRLETTFGITLSDCAAIRRVLDAEMLDGTLIPKQSFLIVLVRNILLHADIGLLSL